MENVSPASLAHSAMILDCFHILGTTLLYWDHFITFGTEVQYIWVQAKSWNNCWFFLNRYFSFLGNIAFLALSFSNLSLRGCHNFLIFHQILLLLTQLVVCCILTLRVYALYTCDRRVLWSLIACGLVLLGVAAFSLVGQHNVFFDQIPGCHLGVTHATAIRVVTPWQALFVYDSIVFGATMIKTYRYRSQHLPGGVTESLFYLMLRDGIVYYGVMMLANLGNILTFYMAGPILRGCLATFSSSVSVTMISRLTLNLHQLTGQSIISVHVQDASASNIELTPRITQP